jgi:hypothetical protein
MLKSNFKNNLLKISDYSNHMIKSSFDIPDPVLKKPKKYIILQDNLFFSLYSKKNKGFSFVYNEKNEKIKLAESLEKIKFKNKEEIMNNLVYDKLINLNTFNSIVMFYKLNVIFIRKCTYVKMNYGEGDFLYMNDQGSLESAQDVSGFLEVNLEKPLRTVSFYKLSDLQEISTKLSIDIEKRKKQELYDSIKMVLSELYKI